MGQPWVTATIARMPHLATRPIPWRIGFFLLGALALWLPVAIVAVVPLGVAFGWDAVATNVTAIASLYTAILTAIWIWGRGVRRLAMPLRSYGWQWGPALVVEIALGVAIAIASMGALFGLEALLGWLTFDIKPGPWAFYWFNGLVVGAGVAFLEEIFFRGWCLAEFQMSFSRRRAAHYSSAFFALLHFIKPPEFILATWPQFPGLWLLGLVLIQGRTSGFRPRRGSLGVPVGLHGAWVCAITVANSADLIQYTGAVPAWVYGLQGNPLMGVAGLAFLGGVLGGLRWWGRHRPMPPQRGY